MDFVLKISSTLNSICDAIQTCHYTVSGKSCKSVEGRTSTPPPTSLLPLEALLLVLSCHSLSISPANLDAVLQTSQPYPFSRGSLPILLHVFGSGLFLSIFARRSPSPQTLPCKATGNGLFPLVLAHYVFHAPCFS